MNKESTPANVGSMEGLGVTRRTVAETDDWKLGCFMEWRPKRHPKECPTCNGTKEIGGGFKCIDGPRQCPECFGSGFISTGPTTPVPELPAALREHMRRAWLDFLNEA